MRVPPSFTGLASIEVAKKSGPAGSSRAGVGRLAAAALASVIWLVRSSGGMSPFLSGLGRPERRPAKRAEEGPDGYRRIMETRFWDSSGCTGVGSRRVGVVRA
jgi:hypothetical protein